MLAVAKKEYELSAEHLALRARIALAYRKGVLPGPNFLEFTRAAREADQEARRQVAAKFGLEPWQL